MHAVDTSLLIRFLTRDVIARSVLLNGDVWIGKTVLLETEWVLRSGFRYTPQAIREAFAELLGLPGMIVEDPTAI